MNAAKRLKLLGMVQALRAEVQGMVMQSAPDWPAGRTFIDNRLREMETELGDSGNVTPLYPGLDGESQKAFDHGR